MNDMGLRYKIYDILNDNLVAKIDEGQPYVDGHEETYEAIRALIESEASLATKEAGYATFSQAEKAHAKFLKKQHRAHENELLQVRIDELSDLTSWTHWIGENGYLMIPLEENNKRITQLKERQEKLL